MMGEEDAAEPSQHVRIEEPTNFIHRKVTTTKNIIEKDASLQSAAMDDEEKARQIADEDLKSPQKQV